MNEGIPAGQRVFVCLAPDGAVWCCTDGGIARFNGEVFIPVDQKAPGKTRIACRNSGGIWAISGVELCVYANDGGKTHVADLQESLSGTAVNQILEDQTGSLWIGTTSSGLFRFRDGTLQKVPTSLENISALAEDEEGTLWAGTWGGGLNRLTPRRFFMHKPLVSICADQEGRIWTVDQRGSLAMRLSGHEHSFGNPAGWNGQERASVVYAAPTGDVWIGTTEGLVKWNRQGFTREPLNEGVRAMAADEKGGLWIATRRNHVVHRGPNGYEPLPQHPDAGDISALAVDAGGRVWCGTRSGRVFVHQNGLLSQVSLPEAELDWGVRFIRPEGDHVWIGTLLGGLYCWRDGAVKRLPPDPALPLAEIRSLYIPPSGIGGSRIGGQDDEFWFGTAQGLFTTTRTEVERRLQGGTPEIAAKRHGFNDGLPNLEFMNGGTNGVARSHDGHLWFATNRGLLEVRPVPPSFRGGPRKVIIEGTQLDKNGGHSDHADSLVLPPKPGLLRIRYTLPDLLAPEQVRFRYRLADGQDGEWNVVGTDREEGFVGLAPRTISV